MNVQSGPLYEATFFVAPDRVTEFDLWLEEHVRGTLREPGIVDCNVLSVAACQDGRARRVCLYTLVDDDTLDTFLNDGVTNIEHALRAEFDDQVEVLGRALRQDYSADTNPGPATECLNCGTRLRGQYCGSCGQRSSNRLISLWEMVSDAFGDLFEIDSRLWRTVVPLVRRPGLLTHDYLQGRRARYMPPFRMYLVLSLLFFVVAFFDPREELSLLFEPPPEPTVEAEEISQGTPEQSEILDELLQEGAGALDELQDELRDELATDGDGIVLNFNTKNGERTSECSVEASDLEDLPGWLARRLTLERLQRICERTRIDDGSALVEELLDNIPAALIVLLPLMAFVLKALYPLSKRYYVEHLLFFVHFHAFFFLLLSLQILFVRVSTWLHMPEALRVLTIVATSLYVPVYLFVAMRRVYLQGRLITTLKYIVLVMAYALGFFTTVLGAFTIAAFSF